MSAPASAMYFVAASTTRVPWPVLAKSGKVRTPVRPPVLYVTPSCVMVFQTTLAREMTNPRASSTKWTVLSASPSADGGDDVRRVQPVRDRRLHDHVLPAAVRAVREARVHAMGIGGGSHKAARDTHWTGRPCRPVTFGGVENGRGAPVACL